MDHCDPGRDPNVRRRLSYTLLLCMLLALPGCEIVKDAAKRSLARFAGGAVAGIAGAGEAGAEDDASVAPDEERSDGGLFGSDDESEAGTGSSGFYKVVEANGTVRFVTSLDEVPAAQRPAAERVARDPIARSGKANHRAPSQQAVKQLAAARTSPPPTLNRGGHEVVIYTTSWCGWCKKTLAWLDQKGVDYENRDVEENSDWAEEMHDLTGSGGVPVIVIDGEVIKGFNQAQMEKLLRS